MIHNPVIHTAVGRPEGNPVVHTAAGRPKGNPVIHTAADKRGACVVIKRLLVQKRPGPISNQKNTVTELMNID